MSLCRLAHSQLHTWGQKTFMCRYATDLYWEAKMLLEAYDREFLRHGEGNQWSFTGGIPTPGYQQEQGEP